MADRFYVNFPLAPGEVLLQGPEAHHLATVRRFQAGDSVTLFNGTGAEYPASIIALGKKIIAINKIIEDYWYHICCYKQRKIRKKALFI